MFKMMISYGLNIDDGALYEQLPFIYRLKLYALFTNGKNETAFF
jgi:hypothetical protein